MKRFLIIATILFSLISLSLQNEKEDQFQLKTVPCLLSESFAHASGMVLDLYYDKINFANFVDKYMKWSSESRAEIAKCFDHKFVLDFKNVNLFNNLFTKLGYTLLYATNCEKDVGPALILLDNVIANLENVKTEWKSALTNMLFLGIISNQSFNDCKASLESITDLWSS